MPAKQKDGTVSAAKITAIGAIIVALIAGGFEIYKINLPKENSPNSPHTQHIETHGSASPIVVGSQVHDINVQTGGTSNHK